MLERIAEWARGHGPWDVVTLVSAEGMGSDWAGSTEAGFYDTFSVDLKYVDSNGRTHWQEVRGSDMDSLWRFLMTSD